MKHSNCVANWNYICVMECLLFKNVLNTIPTFKLFVPMSQGKNHRADAAASD